jgi:lipoprotein-anchoring transpeptidase ErfK/SrfK
MNPVTLPLLDAMFADDAFAGELRSRLGLSDEQIAQIQQIARDNVLQLSEVELDAASSSTKAAADKAAKEIRKVLGDEKTAQLFEFVRQRWGGTEQEALIVRPNSVPSDSRIVVNAPAYRMDVFRGGELVRTYKVGIGYPEFPLPRGQRKAEKIIFNPEWTPPDEPWVKGKFAPGKKVEAGSKDNPLGVIKIPIGLPSLIHGGKNPSKLGTFASHGCVGLTNAQVETFAQDISALAGAPLSPEKVKAYQKNRSKTDELDLPQPVPVELRYETIVVEDGKVHIFRDVYEHGTNTEENLRAVLSVFDVNFDSLDEATRTKLIDALRSMAVDAQGEPVTEEEAAEKKRPSKTARETRSVKGPRSVVVEVPQLAGKGYPRPVNLMG